MNLQSINNVEQLDELLTQPTDVVVKALTKIKGDIIILGIGGKMGPNLGRMIVRASQQAGVQRRVIGVSRFSNMDLREQLESWSIETIAGDLLDPDFVASLPDVPNVICMTGMKFGATGNESLTWAMNTYLPSLVCYKYRNSRMTAFSTGNVYGLTPADGKGSKETDILCPVGEYAMSSLGRERTYEYFCKTYNMPTTLIRLNYSTELRYGVLVDLATRVYHEETIDVSMGHVNVIWQGDAIAMTLAALPDGTTPANILNVSGPEILSVRNICEKFGELMNKPVNIIGEEAEDALLNDGSKGHQLYGLPTVTVETMLPWIVEWIQSDKPSLGKPTHFESRSGKF